MARPFPAYRGDASYVFVCYAHADEAMVYAELERLHAAGVRIWYDEGVAPGSRWSDELAEALSAAAMVLFFCTPDAAASTHCNDELAFALDEGVPVVTVELLPTTLPPGLRLRLGAHQAIRLSDLSRRQFEAKLDQAVATCIGARPAPASDPKPARAGSRSRWLAAAAALAVVAAVAAWWTRPADPRGQDAGGNTFWVAVLPFRAVTDAPKETVFAEVLGQALASELAGEDLAPIRHLFPAYGASQWRVSPYARSRRFAGSDAAPETLARELDASWVVTGSVRLEDDGVRVSTELVRGSNGVQDWADSKAYRSGAGQETGVAQDIAIQVLRAIPRGSWLDVVEGMIDDAQAFEAYARFSRMALLEEHEVALQRRGVSDLEHVVQAQPDFPWAIESLLMAYGNLASAQVAPLTTIVPIEELIVRLEAAVPHLPFGEAERTRLRLTAMNARGRAALFDLDLRGARAAAESVLAERPNDVSALARLGFVDDFAGRHEAALSHFERAVGGPIVVPSLIEGFARMSVDRGRPADAVRVIDRSLHLLPANGWRGRVLTARARALLDLGRGGDVGAHVEEARWLLRGAPAALVEVLVAIGETEEARALLAQAESRYGGEAATVRDCLAAHLALGQPEQAARWARIALESGNPHLLHTLVMTLSSGVPPGWDSIDREVDALLAPPLRALTAAESASIDPSR